MPTESPGTAEGQDGGKALRLRMVGASRGLRLFVPAPSHRRPNPTVRTFGGLGILASIPKAARRPDGPAGTLGRCALGAARPTRTPGRSGSLTASLVRAHACRKRPFGTLARARTKLRSRAFSGFVPKQAKKAFALGRCRCKTALGAFGTRPPPLRNARRAVKIN